LTLPLLFRGSVGSGLSLALDLSAFLPATFAARFKRLPRLVGETLFELGAPLSLGFGLVPVHRSCALLGLRPMQPALPCRWCGDVRICEVLKSFEMRGSRSIF
jgi:hypothetical protein